MDIEYWNGASWLPVAAELPDIGRANWFVPEMFTNGAQIQVLFNNSSDVQIGSATSNRDKAIDSDLTTTGVFLFWPENG